MSCTAARTAEDARWNRLGDTMARFHAWFKQEFNLVYELADGSYTQRRMTLSTYLATARSLAQHLNFHHSIEEAHIFPVLGERMAHFAQDARHLESHRGIHRGLDEMSALVAKYTRDPKAYSPDEMRACLDGFRAVLFRHLDEEVEDLKGENLKKYWTLEELARLPM